MWVRSKYDSSPRESYHEYKVKRMLSLLVLKTGGASKLQQIPHVIFAYVRMMQLSSTRLDLFPNIKNLTSNSLLDIIWTTFIGCLTDNSNSSVQTWTPDLLFQTGSIHSCPHWSEGNSLLFVSWSFCSLTPTASPSGKRASFNSIFITHPYSNYFSLPPLLPPVLSHHPLSPRLM